MSAGIASPIECSSQTVESDRHMPTREKNNRTNGCAKKSLGESTCRRRKPVRRRHLTIHPTSLNSHLRLQRDDTVDITFKRFMNIRVRSRWPRRR